MKKIAIIGGGAAGLAAAVAAGVRGDGSAETHVTIFEATDRVGRPILASGNGRCNFSNAHIDVAQYHNSAFVAEALGAFEALMAQGKNEDVAVFAAEAPNGVVAFFERLGMLWREEGEGRLYPKANKSSVVLDVLRAAALAAGVEVRTGCLVERVELPRETGAPFTLRMADGVFERADAVIVACGGSVAQQMLPDPFGFIPQRPVLGPVATDTRWVKQLDNIRVKCAVELRRAANVVAREAGEVLFRKYGISGIAVFNLSRMAQEGDTFAIDLFPGDGLQDLEVLFAQRRTMLQANVSEPITCADFLRGAVLPQVAHVLVEYAGLKEDVPCSDEDARTLARVCKNFELEYRGIGDAAQCQVHRGGFAPRAFDATTMQALDAPGLYVVGEALDVDGPCGGYNLHWAFASGALAGMNAVACA